MYIFYTGPGGKYASAGTSKRNGSRTSVEACYLGKVLDKERGIYESKERGIFTFNPVTGSYGAPPEDYVPPVPVDGKKRQRKCSVDFGDTFFIDSFLRSTGFWNVVDKINYENPDTLHAMLLFYVLSGLAATDAIYWFEGSVTKLLYPKADLTSQKINDFVSAIGTSENQAAFQAAYIQYIFGNYSPDKNILVDSVGLSNITCLPFTYRNVPNGKVSDEVRLNLVVQKSTGLPLCYVAVPGKMVDGDTLSRLFPHFEAMGITIDTCIIDARWYSCDIFDLFYDEKHECKTGYITRISPVSDAFKQMVEEGPPPIEQKRYSVNSGDCVLFIKKKVMVGAKKDNPAWLYWGLDCSRMSDEHLKVFRTAGQNGLPADVVLDEMQTERVWGILSGIEYDCDEILSAYDQNQAADQIFDCAKTRANPLPLETGTVEAFNGYLMLSYIASCVVKMIQIRLQEANPSLGPRLICLRNQKCTIYSDQIITDPPQKWANDTYNIFAIPCPETLPIADGKLQSTVPGAKTTGKSKAESKKEPDEEIQKGSGTAGNSDVQAKAEIEPVVKKRGRPRGSKNKKPIEHEALQTGEPVKKQRGRPKGSKNRKPLERETDE